jgi:hypothetical protein
MTAAAAAAMAMASNAAASAFASGDYAAAERICSTLLMAQPPATVERRAGWAVNRASCLLHMDPPRLGVAERACLLALKLQPNKATAHEMLARVYHRMVQDGTLWRIYDEVAQRCAMPCVGEEPREEARVA